MIKATYIFVYLIVKVNHITLKVIAAIFIHFAMMVVIVGCLSLLASPACLVLMVGY